MGYFYNLPHLAMPKSYNGGVRYGGRKDKVRITWPNSHLVMWIVTATWFPFPCLGGGSGKRGIDSSIQFFLYSHIVR